MTFADQEMHYGAPYLLMCRGDPLAAEGATSIPSRSTVRQSGRLILHHEQLQGYALHLLTMSAFG